MNRVRLNNRVRKTLRGSSGGFTLIEVLVALALFAIIAITFAGGLATSSRAVLTADVRTNAESLARTEMEYIKNLNYDSAGNYTVEIPDQYKTASYDILPVGVVQLADGLQKITVTVIHEGREVITLEGYKVSR
jgi:prepilin-type N-terminal cleavage/methylation domain-containing protein